MITTDVCPPPTNVMDQTTVETTVTKMDAVSLSYLVSIYTAHCMLPCIVSTSSPCGMLKAVGQDIRAIFKTPISGVICG